MGPSEKSFNQVKAILGKLDRNIDQLRERRSTGREAAPAATPADAARAQPAPAAAPTTFGRTSQYGRATPIPPSSN